jgi:hypothetical protein
MNIAVTTLSLGENYTRDYTLRMIEDILKMSDMDFYITTDCRKIIDEVYPDNPRIHINEFDRKDYKIRLITGYTPSVSTDFNFNLRYLCFEPVKDLDDTLVIFTDCDNSFNCYNKEEILKFVENGYKNGYDFYAPRNSLYLNNYFNEYPISGEQGRGMFWHKVYNYDLQQNPREEWHGASLPAEYLVIFYNNNGKLKKFYDQWKWFHDYLSNKEYTHGTWAEGFEIGASAYVAGFKAYDIGFCHNLWNIMFTANGYKTGPRGGIVHATEE